MERKKRLCIILNYLVDNKRKGRTKNKIAEEIGVDIKTFNYWLKGSYSPRQYEYLENISKTFDCTTSIFTTNLNNYFDDKGELNESLLELALKIPYKYSNEILKENIEVEVFDRFIECAYEVAKTKGYNLPSEKENFKDSISFRTQLNVILTNLLMNKYSNYKFDTKEINIDYELFKCEQELKEQKAFLMNYKNESLKGYFEELYETEIENLIKQTLEKIDFLENTIKALKNNK